MLDTYILLHFSYKVEKIYVYKCIYAKLDAIIFYQGNKKLNMFDRIASKR